VVRREPDNIAAWAELLLTSRGLQLGIDESLRRFHQVVSRCPTHLYAHRLMQQQLCEKWGGSHQLMHAFARQAARSAPAGSPLGGLVAEAHIEEWATDRFSEFRLARHFRADGVRAELRAAVTHSTAHADYRFRLADLPVLNAFAFALAFGRQRRLARQQFRLIKGRVTHTPWAYIGSFGGTRAAHRLQHVQMYLWP
jgi:hypothetical protein